MILSFSPLPLHLTRTLAWIGILCIVGADPAASYAQTLDSESNREDPPLEWDEEALAQLGPAWTKQRLVLEDGTRVDAIGPLFSLEKTEDETKFAIRPFFSRKHNRAEEHEQWQIAYPLVTHNRFGTETRTQILQLLNWSSGQDSVDGHEKKQTLFPFFFRKKSENPDESYIAFVPVYGKLKNRIFKDEIRFVLFPLYAQTKKGDATTENILYPFFHYRYGEGLQGFQIWPLIGLETKEAREMIDNWGDPKLIPGHFKAQALWPFLYYENLNLGTDNPQKHRAIFPFLRWFRSPERDSTTLLWPFFTFTDDRKQEYKELGFPWPFIVFARGEGKTVNRVFPLFSAAKNDTHRSGFFLWPLFKSNHVVDPPLDRRRDRVLLFLFSNTTLKNLTTGDKQVRQSFWPFYTRTTDSRGVSRFQALSLLRPFFPTDSDLAWNYSNLWSLWKSEKNERTGQASQSALWNIYRHDRSPGRSKTSFLFGLFQREKTETHTSTRFFYLPKIKKDRMDKQQ